MQTPPHLPADWYPDQSDSRLLRYWDGRQWTEHTHPAPPAQSVAPPLPSHAASPWSPVQRVPWWQTWWAIVPALLFCFPVGLVFLWMRQGVSLPVKSVVTAVVVVFVLAVALNDGSDVDPAAGAVEDAPSTATAEPSPSPSPSDEVAQDDEAEPAEAKPERARVPDVVAVRVPRARTLLSNAGLTVRVVERLSWKPAGVVLSQGVTPGAKVAPGKTVQVVVAAPMPQVPGVVGQSAAAATNALRDAGFRVVTTAEAVTTGEGGLVLRQAPAGTVQAEPGALVTLVISNKVQPLAPPAPSNCTPGYSPCLPPASDYDCAGGSGDGPKYAGPVRVTGSDPYDLDADGDGFACGGD